MNQPDSVKVSGASTPWYHGRRCSVLWWVDPESGEDRFGLMTENRNGIVHKMALTRETLALLNSLIHTVDLREGFDLSETAKMLTITPDSDQSEPA